MKVYINGEILDESEAKISVFDRGFLYGDGVFETARSYDGVMFRLGDHLDRLCSSMKYLKIRQRLSNKEMERAVYKSLRINNLKNASVRITVSRGMSKNRGFNISQSGISNVVITAAQFIPRPVDFYEKGIKADIARFRKNSRSLLSRFKALNYLEGIMARDEALPKGSFETVFLNEDGYISEGTVSNIFMVKGNRLLTPSIDCGVLPGITRKIVLDLAPYAGLGIAEGKFNKDIFRDCGEAFVTNSLIEIIPLVRIDNMKIGSGATGPATRKIHDLYKELVKKETKACSL